MMSTRLDSVPLLMALSVLSSGCVLLFTKTSSGKIPNTPAEEAFVISKAEPPSTCRMVGGFFGYDTPRGSGFGSVTDDVQFSCIRREIASAKGKYGVIDAVVGSGWYKGRSFACPTAPPAVRASRACTPGATQACVGAGCCKGGQACAADGNAFLPCDCGSGGSAPPIERAAPF